MVRTNWLRTLRATFPHISFQESDTFRWSPTAKTVYVAPLRTEADLYTLLHETGHALSNHVHYTQDLRLIKMEREAWDVAKEQLAPLFDTSISDQVVEGALDSYRDWLTARSRCPECNQTGVQQDETHYRCLVCSSIWRVNDARMCQLRRYKVIK